MCSADEPQFLQPIEVRQTRRHWPGRLLATSLLLLKPCLAAEVSIVEPFQGYA